MSFITRLLLSAAAVAVLFGGTAVATADHAPSHVVADLEWDIVPAGH